MQIDNPSLNIMTSIEDDSDEDSRDEEDIKFEGYLSQKISNKIFEKKWYRLIGEDLYQFENKSSPEHEKLYNLSGIFIKENKAAKIEDTMTYCFSLIFPNKTRIYFTENKEEYNEWIRCIKTSTSYSNIHDLYAVKENIGHGKFGMVREGFNKLTDQSVAIKIMHKANMTMADLQLIQNEIEILRICQHPNIIRLYDVFENADDFYIVMEYCKGGDLFSYLEERSFKITESRAACIIYKLATSLFYLHSYGIVHRDLKPENIMMVDSSENSDIRLLDFGLSKIIGPNETGTEPYGTIVSVIM